eukprot:gene22672-29822_t
MGTLFVTGATVKVGNTNCVATFISATSITCVAPMMPAGEYAISVTDSDTGRSIPTAVAGTAPCVTSVLPVIQPKHLLGGDTLTITGTSFFDGATASIGGDACTNVIVVSATSITCVPPAKSAATASALVVLTNPDTGYNVRNYCFVTYTTYSGTPPTLTSTSLTNFPPLNGDFLIINGTLFGATTGSATNHSINVGGVACTNVNVLSSTPINCTAPGIPAGSYIVVVTNLDRLQHGNSGSGYTPINSNNWAVAVTVPDTGYSSATNVYVAYVRAYFGGVPPIFTATPITTAGSPTTSLNLNGGTLTSAGAAFTAGALLRYIVTIRGSTCSWVSQTDIQIVCTAPAKTAGSYPVVVINADVGSALSPVELSYQVEPLL